MKLLLLTIVLAVLSLLANAKPADDKIESLPGWKGALPSDQYSGYLSIAGGSNIHYWLVESEKDPDNAPTVLWLNGGPGFSSLDGFVYENGPFVIQPDNTLKKRKYRWNKMANMLYIEAPVGVGFSYSDTGDYACSDDRTAHENRLAVEKFFEKFPEFNTDKSKFYIFGESYAGVYIPTLAEAIVQATLDGKYTGAELAGIAIGNGCIGNMVGSCSPTPERLVHEWTYLTQTPFINSAAKDKINAACDWVSAEKNLESSLSGECVDALNEVQPLLASLNMYDIYGECQSDPGCPDVVLPGKLVIRDKGMLRGSQAHSVIRPRHYANLAADPEESNADARGVKGKVPQFKPYELLDRKTGRVHRLNSPHIMPGGPKACIESKLASAYFNQPDVQQAIHVGNSPTGRPCWNTYVTAPSWTYTKQVANIPRDIYPFLIRHLDVLIFNGDGDACVPYTGNDAWTRGMGYPVKAGWHSWDYPSSRDSSWQLAGYATEYDVSALGKGSFEFITIKGGRHEVPESSPAQAYEMLKRVLQKQPF